MDDSWSFSPVAKIYSIQFLISLGANLGWALFQLDFKNAFLHSDLREKYTWSNHWSLLFTRNLIRCADYIKLSMALPSPFELGLVTLVTQ